MAPGRLPKDPGQRRRYNQPARGEWIDLKPLEETVLPELDEDWLEWTTTRDKDGNPIEVRRGVSRRMWEAWRRSPVTSQYGPEDIAACCYLAEAFHSLSDASRFAMMDRLGLTPKGKRDLRWRTPAEVKTLAEQPAPVKRLRVVEPESKAK